MAPRASERETAQPPRAWVSTGPRHTFAALRRAILRDIEAVRARPALLARPLRIVVPSRTLKRRLASTLASAANGALLGVAVETAGEIVEQALAAGSPPLLPAGPFFDLFAERAALAAGSGFPELAGFENATGPLARSCRDVLSAGLHAGNLEEALRTVQSFDGAPGDRARATLRLAVEIDGQLATRRLERYGARADRAAALLRSDPSLLPSREIWIAGFADAPGGTRRLISALLGRDRSNIILDDPAPSRDGEAPLHPHVARFTRLLGIDPVPLPDPPPPPPAHHAFVALRPAHEIEEVARRIRALIDGGSPPESIAVVARSTSPYLPAIRDHFGRQAIPFSGGRLDPAATPAGRAASAILEVLEQGPSARIERWISLTDEDSRLLRVAFQSAGLVTISDLAETDFEKLAAGRTRWELPLKAPRKAPSDGESEASPGDEVDDDDDAPAGREAACALRTLTVGVARLASFADAASAYCRALREWTDVQPAARHAEDLQAVLAGAAPWRTAADLLALRDRIRAVAQSSPPGLSVSRREFLHILKSEWAAQAGAPAGGQGGGVAVLDATRARGLAFDHLFLLGVTEGRYPAKTRADPFLSDAARRSLQRLLPDLAAGPERPPEEAWLFAELSAAAGQTTWSWPRTGSDGKTARASSLLGQRLLEGAAALETAPEFPPESDPRITLRDRALGRALAGDREAARSWLAALFQSPTAAGPPAPARAHRLARARFDALRMFEPAPAEASGGSPGDSPWALLGLTRCGEDDSVLYITALEGMVVCPWQTFLKRVLRIETLPDPIEDAPDVQPLTLGRVVHAVLERILEHPAGHRNLSDALRAESRAVARPDATRVADLAADAARTHGIEDGLHLAGLQRALALRATPLVERALDLLFTDSQEVASFGTEVEGSLSVEDLDGRPGDIRFRADFVQRMDTNGVRLVDWKTGGPSGRKAPVATRLQAAAYARSKGLPPGSEGAYVYLKPGLKKKDWIRSTSGADAAEEQIFRYATRGALSAWRFGFWFPRLATTRGTRPDACKLCDVKEACHQGDTDVKLRYEALAASAVEGNATDTVLRILNHLYPAVEPSALDGIAGLDRGRSRKGTNP